MEGKPSVPQRTFIMSHLGENVSSKGLRKINCRQTFFFLFTGKRLQGQTVK